MMNNRMNQQTRRPVRHAAGLAVMVLWAAAAAAPDAKIVSVDIQSGPRGLAVAVNTDKPVTGEPQVTQKNTAGAARAVSLRIPGVSYESPARQFGAFSDPAVVAGISITPNTVGGFTEITVKTASKTPATMVVKAKGNRILALVATDALPSFTWSSAQQQTMHTTSMQQSAPAEAPRTAVLGRAVALRDRINVRSSPATDSGSAIIGHLLAGDTVPVTQRSGAWTRIIWNGRAAWALTDFLSDSTQKTTPTAAVEAGVAPTAMMATVVKTVAAAVSPPEKPAATGKTPQKKPSAGPAGPRQDSVVYVVYGRDPFMPYSQEESQLPSVMNLELAGVIFGESNRIALLQDVANKGKPHALRESDPVENGTVLKINPTSVIFLLTEMGISRTMTLELKKDLTTKVN